MGGRGMEKEGGLGRRGGRGGDQNIGKMRKHREHGVRGGSMRRDIKGADGTMMRGVRGSMLGGGRGGGRRGAGD